MRFIVTIIMIIALMPRDGRENAFSSPIDPDFVGAGDQELSRKVRPIVRFNWWKRCDNRWETRGIVETERAKLRDVREGMDFRV